MTTGANQLLKLLEPAVRPGGLASASTAPKSRIETSRFDELLAMARSGSIHSGRQIAVEAELSPPLQAAQLERLAAAADEAEAQGATRALMLIDGRGVVIDVASRTLIAELSPASLGNVSGVDAAIFVRPDHHMPGSTAQSAASHDAAAMLLKQLNAQRTHPPLHHHQPGAAPQPLHT